MNQVKMKGMRKARIEKDMTQKELARRLKCHHNTISSIEMGRTNPSLEMLEKIARVLDTTVSQLTEGV